ncbi:hypothetical protein EOM39_07410, partial [Candidatus Gracilibacteria bacterium]|nr:hypothetical protein [Candidatus Gracilibacteria bacterium]
MLNLKINLENNKSYISWGNYFSKSIILKNQDKKILLVVENEKIISIYEKLLQFFGKNIIKIDRSYSLTDYVLNNTKNIYIITLDNLLNINISLYDLGKQSIYLKKEETYDINDLIGKLTNLGYTYNEFLNPGTYRKIGDLVYVISFDGKKEYKMSFWGNTLEDLWVKEKIEDIFF